MVGPAQVQKEFCALMMKVVVVVVLTLPQTTLLVEGRTTSQGSERCGNRTFDSRYEDCCVGVQRSTVVSKEGELCCHTEAGHTPLNKTHPAHTACCAPADLRDTRTERDRIHTFTHTTHYCDEEEGVVRPYPEMPDLSRLPRKMCLTGQEGEGETECCGHTPYDPSRKTCCQDRLDSIPSSASQCCYDRAYLRNDPGSNPCMQQLCGGRPFDAETELCCNDRVVEAGDGDTCCGSSVVRSQEECCGGMVISAQWSCCKGKMPYKRDIMHCHSHSGAVTVRQGKLKKRSIPKQFYERDLDVWGENWRPFVDPKMEKIEGRVEQCGIKLRRNSLIVPLFPAAVVVGGEKLSSCVQQGGSVKLQVSMSCTPAQRLKGRKNRRTFEKRMMSFLRGATLEVNVRPGRSVRCGRGGGLTVRLAEGVPAVVLLSHRMDRLMRESMAQAGRRGL
ncbi:uncharacterized protein LOC143281779 isoform X2 [Babylonia areolata]|uniref:uncharacterized protein LOC143281779 isoform X2 n=1 Tax=Babylonia areolata TaxID=304850 RepID=UPI003FD025D3